jgi:hypothetical protein
MTLQVLAEECSEEERLGWPANEETIQPAGTPEAPIPVS